jgi:hypothetical protein
LYLTDFDRDLFSATVKIPKHLHVNKTQSGSGLEVITDEIREKFLKSVTKEEFADGCWNWVGAKNLMIYEQGTKKKHPARDVAFFVSFFRLPTTCFRMKCGNSLCVNPDHFEARNQRLGRPRLPDGERKYREALKARRLANQAPAVEESPL